MRRRVTKYKRYLGGYAAAQQQAGRFQWALNVRLSNVVQWLDNQHVVPPETEVSMLLAFGFLIVCLVNTIGLLLAKFMRRAPEIGVRRALGASRGAVYAQFLLEAGVVGAGGRRARAHPHDAGRLRVSASCSSRTSRSSPTSTLHCCYSRCLWLSHAPSLRPFIPPGALLRVQPAWQLKSN